MAGVRLCAGRKVRLYHTLYQTNSTTPSLLDQLEKTNLKSHNPTLVNVRDNLRQPNQTKQYINCGSVFSIAESCLNIN